MNSDALKNIKENSKLTVLDDRGKIEIAIIEDMFRFAKHYQSVEEIQKAVKAYFGDNYDYYASIYDEFKRHGHVEIERHFIDDDTFAKMKSISTEIVKAYDKYKEKIEDEVNKLFGIDLPKIDLVTIIIQKSEPLSSYLYGGTYLDGMGVITLKIYNDTDLNKEIPKIISILIHEMLHAAFDKSGIRNKLSHAQEEALLRYFAPNGILSLRLGLIKSLDLDKLYESESKTIHNSDDSDEFKKLLPYIKEYYAQLEPRSGDQKSCEQNILKYLTDKINFNNKA